MVYEIIADKQQFSCEEAKVQEVVQAGLWTEVNVPDAAEKSMIRTFNIILAQKLRYITYSFISY